MKARVKATGEIVEVIDIWKSGNSYYERLDVCDTKPIRYSLYELDFLDILGGSYETTYTLDYWTRLEHTYAGIALQGILGNQTYTKHLLENGTSAKDAKDIMVNASYYLAHALMEKMKAKKEE